MTNESRNAVQGLTDLKKSFLMEKRMRRIILLRLVFVVIFSLTFHFPEPVEIANDYFEYRSSYQREGDKIIYQGELRRKAVKISPEEYPHYQRFCTMMGKSFKQPVLFREARQVGLKD